MRLAYIRGAGRLAVKGISRLALVAVVLILTAAAAVSYSLLARSSPAPSDRIAPSKVSYNLVMGGASFINPQMQVWVSRWNYAGIPVSYSSVGSGAGVSGFLQGTYTCGASDVPLTKEKYQEAVRLYGSIITVPVIVGSIAVIYNLPGLSSPLILNGEALAAIYLGRISFWDDPRIKQLNPGTALPHESIIAVHRSDGSGTTAAFTTYLYAVSEEWRGSGVGTGFTVRWPVDALGTGLGGKGNEGVAALVQQTPFSIGYVEYQYAAASSLPSAQLINHDGLPVFASRETVAAALNGANLSRLPSITADWSNYTSFFMNLPGHSSYPIVTFSYLICKAHYSNIMEAAAVYLWLRYLLTAGQSDSIVLQGYIPLPSPLASRLLEQVNAALSYQGRPVRDLLLWP